MAEGNWNNPYAIEDKGKPDGWSAGKLYQEGRHLYGYLDLGGINTQTTNGRLVNFASIPYSILQKTYCSGQMYGNGRYYACTYQLDTDGKLILISPLDSEISVLNTYVYIDAYIL